MHEARPQTAKFLWTISHNFATQQKMRDVQQKHVLKKRVVTVSHQRHGKRRAQR